MEYTQPIGEVAGAPYVDGDPIADIPGSAVPAAAIEHPMREIVEVITALGGLTPDADDLTQLRQSIAAYIGRQVPSGYISGLEMSRPSATTVAVVPGAADCGGVLARLSATVTKNLGAPWSSGDGGGGLFSGGLAASTWYHAHIMREDTTGAVDVGFSTSATAADAPVGWTCRRIGAVKTDGSAAIRAFVQVGGRFDWLSPPLDMYLTTGFPGSAGTSYTVSVPPVPCEWHGIVGFNVPDGGGYGSLRVTPTGVTVSPSGTYDHLTVTDDGDQAGFQTLSYVVADQKMMVAVMQGSPNALFLRTYGWREERI
jgi:hypothetical protein